MSDTDWQMIVKTLPVPLYAIDTGGQILWFNNAAEDLWGRTPTADDHWDGAWRLYWPDGRPMSHTQSPAALGLLQRCADPVSDVIVERPNGTRALVSVRPALQFNRAGEVSGVVSTLAEQRTDRETSDQRALAAIVETSRDAIIGKDLNGIINSWNDGAARLFGYTAEEMLGQSITRLIPASLLSEEEEIIRRIRRGERVENFTTIRQHKNGQPIDTSIIISPITDANGRVTGAFKIAREITEERRMLSQQSLLLREMNHRVKNLFALAGALVTLSARHAETPAAMASNASARLNALAKAHGLTLGVANSDAPATLEDLLRSMILPFADAGQVSAMLLDGPEILIDTDAVTGFALLVHELATNAAKYGAFSAPGGRVEVRWNISGEQLHLTWTERGGPPLTGRPASEGFGTLLARSTVKSRLGGEISYAWDAEGITVHVTIARNRLRKTARDRMKRNTDS
ncbi:MAG: PAS domain S-box protein [Sphingomonadaceae bacterium]